MSLNVFEIEERAILQCEEVRPEELHSKRIDANNEFDIRGGLSDNM